MSKTLIEMVSDGQICAAYGQKYVISICPALDIDKVRFSIVSLKTNGSDHNDVYLSTEEARLFFEEVDKNIALRKFDAPEAKSSQYPNTYQYIKGSGGIKKLSMGGGMKGIRVQISQPKKDGKSFDHKMSVLQYSDLQTASFLYKLITGLITVPENSFYGKIYKAYWENAGKYAKKNAREYDSTADGAYKAPEAIETTLQSQPTDKATTYNTYSKGSPYKKGDYTIVPTVIEGEEMRLIFTDEISSTLKWFEPFLDKVRSEAGATLKVLAKRETGNNLIFMGLPA